MPNWCSSAYVIEGDAKEIKSLYELMKNWKTWKTFSGKRLRDYMAGMPCGCLGQGLERCKLSW